MASKPVSEIPEPFVGYTEIMLDYNLTTENTAVVITIGCHDWGADDGEEEINEMITYCKKAPSFTTVEYCPVCNQGIGVKHPEIKMDDDSSFRLRGMMHRHLLLKHDLIVFEGRGN